MTIGINVRNIITVIGTAEYLTAFFNTVCANLEPAGWGSRFPILMTRFYRGTIEQKDALAALAELRQIKAELSQISPDHIVWDIRDPEKRPPDDVKPPQGAKSLAEYFVTASGLDFITELEDILKHLSKWGGIAEIAPISKWGVY